MRRYAVNFAKYSIPIGIVGAVALSLLPLTDAHDRLFLTNLNTLGRLFYFLGLLLMILAYYVSFYTKHQAIGFILSLCLVPILFLVLQGHMFSCCYKTIPNILGEIAVVNYYFLMGMYSVVLCCHLIKMIMSVYLLIRK